MVGNHDCYYKNTNEINSPELLLKHYSVISKHIQKRTEINSWMDLRVFLLTLDKL